MRKREKVEMKTVVTTTITNQVTAAGKIIAKKIQRFVKAF